MATKKASTEIVEVDQDDPNVFVKDAKGLDYTPKSWEDIAKAFEGEGGIITFEGSPYAILDKKLLLDIPFVITDVRIWHSEKFDNDAISVCLMTKDPLTTGRVDPITGEKEERTLFVINDGSTGLMQQVLDAVGRTGRKAGFLCANGLRSSTYTVEVSDPFEPDKAPKSIEATTYYIQ